MSPIFIPEEIVSLAFNTLFISMMALMIPMAFLSRRFSRILRETHPHAWKELGEPSLSNLSIQVSRRLAKYMKTRGYESLEDPELNRCARWMRMVERLTGVVFVSFFSLIVLSAIFGQR